MSDVVLVGIIAATASVGSSIVTTFAQYIKDKSLKGNDIIRKDLNTLYVLNNEINLNKKILESNLDYMNNLNVERVNFYFTGLVPQNFTWKIIKNDSILCIVDDRILTQMLFDFYSFVDQSIIMHTHENEEMDKGTVLRNTVEEVLNNIDSICNRLNAKIDKLHKKLK